jgi:hypothetical protein
MTSEQNLNSGTDGGSECNDELDGEILHLHLKYEYFDDIASGKKPKEYRDAAKWQKRLDAKKYRGIRLYRGFQKISPLTIIDLPYSGYELETITHPHFGNEAKLVCAINVMDAYKFACISGARVQANLKENEDSGYGAEPLLTFSLTLKDGDSYGAQAARA